MNPFKKENKESRMVELSPISTLETLLFSKTFANVIASASIGLSSMFTILALLSFLKVIELPLSTNDLILIGILSGTSIYGFYQYFRSRYIWKIDSIFPDFVRDLAESRKAGMTFTKAIFMASKSNYGLLTLYIKRMAGQISWGASVQEAMEDFAKRIGTPLVKRIVSLINEASKSGGSITDVLMAAADNAREYHFLKKERKANISSYVIVVYVSSLVFLLITLILIKQFLPMFSGEAMTGLSSITSGASAGSLQMDEIKLLFFYSVLVQSMGSGIVAGVFEDGRLESGVKHAFVLSIIAWLAYKILVGI